MGALALQVFDDKGVYIVNPADGNKEELYRNEDLCSPGEDCSNWGYPGTDGQYVVVANYNGQSKCWTGSLRCEHSLFRIQQNLEMLWHLRQTLASLWQMLRLVTFPLLWTLHPGGMRSMFTAGKGQHPIVATYAALVHDITWIAGRASCCSKWPSRYCKCKKFRPGDDQTQPEDGLVDVLSTNNWGLKNPWCEQDTCHVFIMFANHAVHVSAYDNLKLFCMVDMWYNLITNQAPHLMQIGAAHNSGYMHAYIALSKELKQYAWGTNMQDPGIHRIDLCNPGGVSMVLELDLEAEEVEVVQKIEVDGTPYVTEDGNSASTRLTCLQALLDLSACPPEAWPFSTFPPSSCSPYLMLLQAKSNGQTNKISVISDPDIEGFSQLAFAVSGSEHVAVITSFSQNKVRSCSMCAVLEVMTPQGCSLLKAWSAGQKGLAALQPCLLQERRILHKAKLNARS
eukprot:1138512-Pelagomonas_calceolata.AAC.5